MTRWRLCWYDVCCAGGWYSLSSSCSAFRSGYEPNAYDLKETYVESYTESLTHPQFSEQGFLEDVEYDDTALEDMLREAHRVHVYHSQREGLSVGQSSSSVSERTGDPLESEQGDLLDQVVRSQMLQMHRLELCWTDRRCKFSPNVRRKLRNMNYRLIMTEEVYENLVKLLTPSKKNIIALKLKNVNDEINNFFMNVYCSKIRNNVKLIIKVSMKWKN